jgi:hypothetical protein
VRALLFALLRAGKSKPARMAIMAMTTSSSMRVNLAVLLLMRIVLYPFVLDADLYQFTTYFRNLQEWHKKVLA